ncbi:DMT family transporter [Flavilitoribacter nigricans]|uniref:EamA family transporter n=1 Tax=Flavilitoribacter nigricans (strain ATCC 23147 / DSM 23189 / NBRC 102662 / NCIMB 1420 / SS-2) TaxID=1122177 RepID=A0A2D0NAP0_FLAN2|nr:EamA family transporter [Flavilitoribacter nigricans]PHN04843.1 EamA family transporter [Flavilitoribacter nigricans DSM 23189 = NBRC 102662]
MTPIQRSYVELHIAVFLFGFTAILGDLISLPALSLVWWRVFFTTLSFPFIVPVIRLFRTTPTKTLLKFMGIGLIVALHWVCFFGAIKLSNPSIVLVCMATTSFFTSLVEPIFSKKKIKTYEIVLGLMIVPGMILIVNGAEVGMLLGIGIGLTAALLAAFFATLNKLLVGKLDEKSVSFLELGSAWLFLSLVIPVYYWFSEEGRSLDFWPQSTDWLYLTILALLCTTLAYVLALRSLRHLTAFASNLTVNLEPVYGIVLAFLLLDDKQELDPGFYWGALVILLAVFSYPVMRRWNKRKQNSTL